MKKFIILAAALLLAGCPGNKDSNSLNGYPAGLNTCPTCSGINNANTLLVASSYYQNMAMTVRMLGDGYQIQQLMYTSTSPAKVYSGQVSLQGAINVSQNTYAGNCIIPAGQYQITSMTPGTYQMGTFSFPQFQLVAGAYSLTVAMSGIIVDADGNGTPEGFGGKVYFLQGPSYYGQLAACNDPIGFVFAP
jgi:hypothetical protein